MDNWTLLLYNLREWKGSREFICKSIQALDDAYLSNNVHILLCCVAVGYITEMWSSTDDELFSLCDHIWWLPWSSFACGERKQWHLQFCIDVRVNVLSSRCKSRLHRVSLSKRCSSHLPVINGCRIVSKLTNFTYMHKFRLYNKMVFIHIACQGHSKDVQTRYFESSSVSFEQLFSTNSCLWSMVKKTMVR